jgi:hypothetical protein
MKRHILPVVALLLLSSCTEVSDFGAYWGKGFVDPALQGTWKKIGTPGQNLDATPGPDQLLFVKEGLSYSLRSINPIDTTLSDDVAAQRKKDNEFRLAVRTLKIGKHLFFMERGQEPAPDGTQNGILVRYEIKCRILREYFVENGAAVDLMETKHPGAKNIGKNTGEGRYIVIRTFDDEVFHILSEISDDSAYWDLECQYRKAS